jgi:hypothetical protein
VVLGNREITRDLCFLLGRLVDRMQPSVGLSQWVPEAPVGGPNGCRSGSVPIRPNPFGPDPELPAMLLCTPVDRGGFHTALVALVYD